MPPAQGSFVVQLDCMKLFFISCLLLAGFNELGAQEKGSVVGTALEGATISLLKPGDSSLVKLAIAGKEGRFEINQLAYGQYLLRVSAIGHISFNSAEFSLDQTKPVQDFGILTLVKNNSELQAVTISATKRMIEVRPDKTLVNVDAILSSAGATALEVLEKSPGITVDRDGNISLKGRAGVLVLVDGKPSYLAGPDLVNLLNTMMANQLDQIEIMTNPPAKYDAAGNSGIINIKTKKNKQRGWNGSLNLSIGQGVYAKTSNGLQLNYRNEKINLFLSYSQHANKNFNQLFIRRSYLGAESQPYTGFFDQPSFMRITGLNNTLKLGLDYYLSKKTTLGISSSGFISPRKYKSSSTGYLMNADKVVDSIVQTTSNNSNKWLNGMLNLNFRRLINTTTELTADLDYMQYDMTNRQLFHNTITLANQAVVSDGYLKGDLPATIRIYTAKSDYTTTLFTNWKMEAGLKTSLVQTNNKANYYNSNGTNWTPDYGKTNQFLYEESIYAAYVNSTKKIGAWSAQGGVRFEHTQYKGKQLGNPEKNDSSFSRKYANLFPTLYLTHELDSNHTLTLQAGRRIDRPAYQQLNPFLFFINEYTYQVGNPYIQPQFTWNMQLSHTYKGWLSSSLEYASTKQYFSQLFKTEGRVTILTEGNLATMKNLNLTLTAQWKPTGWWSASISGTGIFRKVTGSGSNQDFNSETFSGNGNINNQFTFKKGWSAELSGFYEAKNRDAQFLIYGFGQVSAGIGKQVLKGKANIRLNIRDIFFTQPIKGDIRYQQVRERFNQSRDSRVATLSFNWRFGKQLGESRKRSGSSSEEQNRVRAGG